MELIPRADLERRPLVRPTAGRIYLANGLFAGPVGFAIALFITLTGPKHGVTTEALLAYYAVIIVGFGGAAIFMGQIFLNLGIELGNDGVTQYRKATQRGMAIRDFYPWETLGVPTPNLAIVYFSEDNPFSVSYNQARAVAEDPRYPLRGQLSTNARKRLGLVADGRHAGAGRS
jgi:hypothetical protein